MATEIPTLTSDYTAIVRGAGFRPLEQPGYLTIDGDDRIDFLNRQTTNDVNELSPGRAVRTVLTSPTARIQDLLSLLWDDGSLVALCLEGRAAQTARHLRGKIFFMDKVAIQDQSQRFAQFQLDGPGAPRVLAALGLAQPPALDAIADFRIGDASLRVLGQRGWAGSSYRLVIPAETAADLTLALEQAGAVRTSTALYEVLRVEGGVAGPDSELTEDYNPLEAGLGDIVSERKGCYTGQEILARQISYDKVTKRLAGLKLATAVSTPAVVAADGRSVGEITSSVVSPRFGPIALAYLKRPTYEPGSRVVVQYEDGVPAEVVALPFV